MVLAMQTHPLFALLRTLSSGGPDDLNVWQQPRQQPHVDTTGEFVPSERRRRGYNQSAGHVWIASDVVASALHCNGVVPAAVARRRSSLLRLLWWDAWPHRFQTPTGAWGSIVLDFDSSSVLSTYYKTTQTKQLVFADTIKAEEIKMATRMRADASASLLVAADKAKVETPPSHIPLYSSSSL
ncbi:hypothetical protein EDB89DRAFT_2245236 [Lactarius sanguifluus]|nr:hypothetical protein EDB89DRAFT_2245236 [Lactarius sanguifluus]